MTGIKIISGEGSKLLGEAIVAAYHKYDPNVNLGEKIFKRFADGEFKSFPKESVRGDHVFIIQSTFTPLDNFWELAQLIDACKRASAHRITAVIPYMGYARQDRKSEPRVGIAAKMVAKFIEAAGANDVVLMDLHADQIQGFFEIPVNHLYASSVLVPYLKQLNLSNVVIGAPDMGASKRVRSYAKFLNKQGIPAETVICDKVRPEDNKVEYVKVYEDTPIEEKNIILVDDMIDTAGTITAVCNALKEKNVKSIRVLVAHGVLSEGSYENIDSPCIEEVIVTDSIPLKIPHPKIKVVSIAPHIAEVINNIYNNRCISNSFIQKA